MRVGTELRNDHDSPLPTKIPHLPKVITLVPTVIPNVPSKITRVPTKF
jgi:hypothetical protein